MKAGQDITQEIEFFNRFTRDREYDSLTPYGYHSIVKEFHKCLGGPLQGQRALDLGCGTGSFSRRFFSPGTGRCYGVDVASNAIQRAHARNDGIRYLVADAAHLNFKEQTFDIVIYSGVLHHFPDLLPSLKEAYRVLKKGGHLLSYDPHIHHPLMWLYRHPDSPLYSARGKTVNERLFSIPQLSSALGKAGFSDVDVHAISGVTIRYLESRRTRFLLPVYNGLEVLWGLSPFARRMGSFVIGHARKGRANETAP